VADAAYHGLVGDFVRAVFPVSESDPAALLISFLVGVGSLVGRHVYYQVERDRHYCNLFALIAGATGHARKGSSWGWVRSVLELTDLLFVVDNLKSGLSTGEGLIHHVRDGTTTPPLSTGKTGTATERDPGIADKRLLIYESEFARVIALLEREGSTLSPMMRQAWESGMLSTLTKLNAERATGAHISILAHITPGELRKKLRTVELTNGFANRFLFVASRRSKHLPDGGHVADGALEQIAGELRHVVDCAQPERRLEMTPRARALWHEVYAGELNDVSASELLEAATSRAAPQVLRLSCVYAVLDRTDQIDFPHLGAALAVWRYSFDSAAYMLGLATGNPTADRILTALKGAPEGLDRTDLSALFGTTNLHRRSRPRSPISRIEATSSGDQCSSIRGNPGGGPSAGTVRKKRRKRRNPRTVCRSRGLIRFFRLIRQPLGRRPLTGYSIAVGRPRPMWRNRQKRNKVSTRSPIQSQRGLLPLFPLLPQPEWRRAGPRTRS